MPHLNNKKRRLFRICVSGRGSRILSPRSTLVGQGGSDSPLGCHSLPPHSHPPAPLWETKNDRLKPIVLCLAGAVGFEPTTKVLETHVSVG